MNYELHHNCTNCTMPPAVVSTSRKTLESHPSNPNFAGRASAFPAQVAQRALGFADPQKNKINLYFVDRSVRIDKDNKMIAK